MGHSDAKINNKRVKTENNSHESSIQSQSEFYLNRKEKRSPTEPQLCQNKFYEECPSSAITDTVYTAGVSGMDFWELRQNSLNGGKDFSAGRVELQIRDRFDLTDFAEIAYQTKEVIAHQFGEQTLKLHYALAAIAFRKPEAWNQKITVSASKLLTDFGEDKKRNHYISQAERSLNKESTRYLSKPEKMLQLAHHVYLLKRLEVWVREWRDRHKGIFTVEMSNLWDVYSIKQIIQKSLHGEDKLIDIEITYSPGSWFEKFAGHEYLREFGYLSSESLKLDPYREKMALRLAYYALFALQKTNNNLYKVETLLRNIGYGQEIEMAKSNRNVALNLKRSFDRGLKTLAKFEHPYSFIYESDVPQWVDSDSKIKKPKHWFDSWLECSGILVQPEFRPQKKFQLPKNDSHQNEIITPKNHDSLTFGQLIKAARNSSGISLRTTAKELNISPSRLSQIENDRYPHQISSELENQLLDFFGLK
jgi:DNA-binding XRE family transcriptional regulator